mgnify:CR=1 FL=1
MPSWEELMKEVQPHIDDNGVVVPGIGVDELRSKYMTALSEKTGRNVIAYYSGWLLPGQTGVFWFPVPVLPLYGMPPVLPRCWS